MLPYVIAALIGLAAGGAVCFPLGIRYRKQVSEKEISSAEEEGTRIINEAIKSAEAKKREALVEAKEEILKSRSEYEREEKARRADLQRQENRLQQKEENLDRKTEAIEKKEESLAQKHAAIDRENEEIKTIKRSQTEMLERISGFTADEAKQYLIDQVESEVTHETALKIKEVESRMKEECEARAREVVAQAIQRCAADQVSEMTVSVVPLPNDEMKGASTPPTLRRWWRRPAGRWRPLSRARESGPCLSAASAISTRSSRRCWAVSTTAPATGRTSCATPSRSPTSRA